MNRREFITLLGGAAAWPLAARAQQAAVPVIGFLFVGSPPNILPLPRFRQGLKEAGYGENVAIEVRSAGGDNQIDRLQELAADLVRHQVSVIVTFGGAMPALAAKAITSTVPIVFSMGPDPVKYGLVASLSRPGGNITGVTNLNHELAGKRLDLLRQLVPRMTTVGYLAGVPGLAVEDQKSDIVEAARALGLQVIVLEVRSERDFEAAFATLVERRVDALTLSASPLTISHLDVVSALAARYSIPAIYGNPWIVQRGGLISYGADFLGAREAGAYVGRILKGEKPGDLPILQPTKFELFINLKTAKALGLTVPPTLLAIADEVIE
jgi:putative ABC transport system substrate-binding protein